MSEKTKTDKPAVLECFKDRIFSAYSTTRGNLQIVVKGNLVTISFIGVDLVQYVILVDFDKLNDEHKYVKCVEKSYQMKYDTITYRFYRMNDEFKILDIIENALALASAPLIHDEDGFVKLLPKRWSRFSKYFDKKKRAFLNDGHLFSKSRTVIIYSQDNPSEEMLDYVDSIALDVMLFTDVAVNVHHNQYNGADNYVTNDEAELLVELVEIAKELDCKPNAVMSQISLTRVNTRQVGSASKYEFDPY
jgi:hypothetical protein